MPAGGRQAAVMPPPMPPPPRSGTGGGTQAAELGGEQQCHGEDGYPGGSSFSFPLPYASILPPPSSPPSPRSPSPSRCFPELQQLSAM